MTRESFGSEVSGVSVPGPAERVSFRSLLRQHRRAVGLTQAELARRAGLSERTIQDLERGISIPRHETADRLFAALTVTSEARAQIEAAMVTSRRPGGQVALWRSPAGSSEVRDIADDALIAASAGVSHS